MHQQRYQSILRQYPRAGLHTLFVLLLHHADGIFHQVADNALHIPAHIAHLCELGGLHLNEGSIYQPGQPAGNLRFAHTRGANHQNVLGTDFFPHGLLHLGAAVAVAQGNGHAALGLVLANNIAVQLPDDFPGR